MAAEADIIVKQILLSLPSYRPGSSRSNTLFKTLADKTQSCLKDDPKSLASARFYMDLMAYLAIEKAVVSPTELLLFYVPSLVAKPVLLRLSPDDQLFVIWNVAEALTASEKGAQTSQHITLRNHSVEASPILFEVGSHSFTPCNAEFITVPSDVRHVAGAVTQCVQGSSQLFIAGEQF